MGQYSNMPEPFQGFNSQITPQEAFGDVSNYETEYRLYSQILGQTRPVGPDETITLLQMDGLKPDTYTINAQEVPGTGERECVGLLQWGIGGAVNRAEVDIRRGVSIPVRASNLKLDIRNDGAVQAQVSGQIVRDGTGASAGVTPVTRTFSFPAYVENTLVPIPPYATGVLVLIDSGPVANETVTLRDINGVAVLTLIWSQADRSIIQPRWITLPPVAHTIQLPGYNGVAHFINALQL